MSVRMIGAVIFSIPWASLSFLRWLKFWGIFYINLKAIKRSELQEALPLVLPKQKASFSTNDGMGAVTSDEKEQVRVSADVIPYLIGESVNASPMLVPQITQPDRVGWTYRESTWPVAPREPRIRGRVVFINEPSVVSYGETCMAMIANYRLATLVGDSTAGCNGNVSFIPLLGGFRVMWTGMDVRKHDRTSFYMTGFVPDYPVSRTINAVKNGVDEYLDKA
ncbi:MAG: S41 family peptidase [Nibricoccus sp.]